MSDTNAPILQVAAKAILVNAKGQILILREAGDSYTEGTNAGRYHGAVGGRIKPDEKYIDGLRREVEEEVGITDFTPMYPVNVGDWWPVINGNKHHIVGIFMVCKTNTSKIQLSEEHDEYKWISPEERTQYDIVNGDREALDAFVAPQAHFD
jgi:8-oxo-dGTP pyrophosphatase MutT (NUDIX family)